MGNNSQIDILAPLFRLLMELTAWLWFIVLSITVDPLYIVGFLLSAILLGVFNFPGDKTIDGPVNVAGWVRIINEWFSGGLLSIIGAWILFSEIGLIIQIVIFVCVIALDRERYYWMLGFKDSPPNYVSILRKE